MNILLSAYACFDNFGSEPGVGYRWLNRLLLDNYNVTLATSGWSHARLVEQSSPILNHPNLKLIIIGTEKSDSEYRKSRMLYQGYLIYWQFLLRKKIQSSNRLYDVVHHITYGGVSIPSFIAKYGSVSIYGPVGGAENAPLALAGLCGYKSMIKELLKKTVVLGLMLDPFILYTKYSYKKILLKNISNLAFYNAVKERCQIKSEIAAPVDVEVNKKYRNKENADIKRVIFSGRGIYWKGGVIAIKVVEYIRNVIGRDDIVLEFYGDGKEFSKWRVLSENSEYISFNDRMVQSEYLKRVNSADCLLFPSFHDSSGNVILESLCRGIPVVAFKLGGPSSILYHENFLVDPNVRPEDVVKIFSEKVVNAIDLSEHEKDDLSRCYINRFSEENLLKGVYK